MSSISSSSSNHPLASKMRTLSIQGKPAVTISLDGEHGSYMTSYSNLDKLEGQVSITAPSDTRFDELDISLLGPFALIFPSTKCLADFHHRHIRCLC